MASNFKLFLHETRDSLHVELFGDFDGTSAFELFNILQDRAPGSYQVFIDTEGLNTVYPFGRDVFQKNMNSSDKQLGNLIFIGKHKNRLTL